MRIWIMSDLHLDVRGPRFGLPDPAPEHDVVVIAGDVRENCREAVRWIARQRFAKPVVFVPGNHEFYNDERDGGLDLAREEAAGLANVHLLHDGHVDIPPEAGGTGGVRFIGSTLWTDYRLDGEAWQAVAMRHARQAMNDHRMIGLASGRPWLPSDCLAEHDASRAYIDAMLQQPIDGPKVVVTHHAPSPRSIHPRYRGDVLNGAFASDLEPLMDRADLWVHGHVHAAFDYRVGDCRVVCNPRGYVGHGETTGFDPRLVVEV